MSLPLFRKAVKSMRIDVGYASDDCPEDNLIACAVIK
jgi:hypothetical protein